MISWAIDNAFFDTNVTSNCFQSYSPLNFIGLDDLWKPKRPGLSILHLFV